MPDRNFISRVALRNFKSIRHCNVQLGQITFLVGLNGAGKSNFLEGLRFLSNALSTSLEAALVEAAGFVAILRRETQGHPKVGFEVDFRLGVGAEGTYRVEIEASADGAIASEECTVRFGELRHWFRVARGKVESSLGSFPSASSGRLYLVNASGLEPFEPVYRALSNIEVYNPLPSGMRLPATETGIRNLDRTGKTLTEIACRMKTSVPERFDRVVEYLQRVNPSLAGVEILTNGSNNLRFELKGSGERGGTKFTSLNMSDGTLRALTVLVALFQDNPRHPLSLIGLEEPEAGLHPAAAGVLFDALMEGSQFRQVIVTSHSPDLLDRDDIPEDALKAVVMEDGETFIGDVDFFGKKAMKEHLYTAGELLRMDQLRPEKVPELSNIG